MMLVHPQPPETHQNYHLCVSVSLWLQGTRSQLCQSPAPASPGVSEGWTASATDRMNEDTDTSKSGAWPLMKSSSLFIYSLIT